LVPYVLIGLLTGLLVGALFGALGGSWLAPVMFGAMGYLGGWVVHLGRRLSKLEGGPAADPWRGTGTVDAPRESTTVQTSTAEVAREDLAPEPPPEPTPSTPPPAPPSPTPASWVPEPTARDESRIPSAFDRVLGTLREWFTSGNVPVKVGVVVLLFGVGFFIKYAVDHELFRLPMAFRLACVAVFGAVLFAIGWHQRAKRPIYALTLQGGGMAILYLTTYAAFGFYDLVPPTTAFAVMVGVTVATGAIAVVQDSRVLVVLGVAGGFAAPLLAASEEGNHVVLFSYYVVLNGAILVIAWFKTWRVLNLLGFAFTFVIASVWGYQGYRPEHFATTEPFLVVFVLMYIGIAVLFARRRPPNLRGFVDSAVVFGPPLIGFALQTRLVESDLGLAATAGGLAVLYAALATVFWRARDLRTLAASFGGLAVLFLTVAIPLALDGLWTSAAWAVQGATLAWFGMRNGSRSLGFVGSALQIAAAVAHVLAPGWIDEADVPVLNGYFLGGVLIALAGWTIGWSFEKGGSSRVHTIMARLALGWGGGWWFAIGAAQVQASLAESWKGAMLGIVALSAAVATILSPAIRWPRFNSLALVLMPAMAILVLDGVASSSHPLGNYGWVVWPLALGVQLAFLRGREADYPEVAPFLHVGTYWVGAVLLGHETLWLVGQVSDGAWPVTAAVAAVSAMTLATVFGMPRLAWPLGAHRGLYSTAGVPVVAGAAVFLVLLANLASSGDAAPLPYVPLVNPLAIASGLAGAALWLGLDPGWRERASRPMVFVIALVGLFLLSMEVARGVHHFAEVPFNSRDLGQSASFQTGLSLVWGTAGLAGMVFGAIRERRDVWIGGAVVMGIVIVKLVLVDLGNAGTLDRVVSFLGVGVLLLIVGYLAPVPKGRREVDGPGQTDAQQGVATQR